MLESEPLEAARFHTATQAVGLVVWGYSEVTATRAVTPSRRGTCANLSISGAGVTGQRPHEWKSEHQVRYSRWLPFMARRLFLNKRGMVFMGLHLDQRTCIG